MGYLGLAIALWVLDKSSGLVNWASDLIKINNKMIQDNI